MDKRNFPLVRLLIDLPVNKIIVKSRRRRFLTSSSIHYPPRSRPVQSPQAHRAGLTGSIDRTIPQLVIAQPATGIPDSHDLSMGRGVISGCYLIAAFPDHLPISDYDTTKRSSQTAFHSPSGQVYRLTQKNDILFCHHKTKLHDPVHPGGIKIKLKNFVDGCGKKSTEFLIRVRATHLFPLKTVWTIICFITMAFNRILDFSNGLDFYLGFFFLYMCRRYPSVKSSISPANR
jgi:hypothetical protein